VTGSSNTVPFTVLQTASVNLTGATVAGPAAPGSTVSFTNTVTNTGNGSDTFNITLSPGNFPSGTTFQLFKADGVTPLVDTNSDGTADTGPLAPGATYSVILKATLPPGATNAGAPFIVAKTARSVFDSTKSATANDQLTAVSSASVDATNNSPAAVGVPGVGVFANGEGAAQVTNTLNAGASTIFTIVANNTGASSDTYNLGASTVNTFSSVTLPAGWAVSLPRRRWSGQLLDHWRNHHQHWLSGGWCKRRRLRGGECPQRLRSGYRPALFPHTVADVECVGHLA
jgi:hypothetical protein